jgi:hypothetical protein
LERRGPGVNPLKNAGVGFNPLDVAGTFRLNITPIRSASFDRVVEETPSSTRTRYQTGFGRPTNVHCRREW